ncbi:MAG: HU family DNA-binding protein [Myxococcota bacterium]
MKYDDLVRHLSEQTQAPKAQVKGILKELATTLRAEAEAGNALRLPGVGTFDQGWSAPRVVRDIRSGRRSLVDGRYRVRFRPAKSLREAVGGRAPKVLNQPAHQKAWQLADTLLADLAMYGALKAFSAAEHATNEALRDALRTQAGADWAATLQSYETGVPEAVRAECDHLALAARHRFR